MLQRPADDFDAIRSVAETHYKSIRSVACPYFREQVHFNSKGLEHLKFVRKNQARPVPDQRTRFAILKYAPEVLRLSGTLQGTFSQAVWEWKWMRGRLKRVQIEAVFFEFVAVIDNTRIRVIVKQLADSPTKYFWSVTPFWEFDRRHHKRIFHYGAPNED